MTSRKALNATCNDDVITIEEYVKNSEVSKNMNSTINFDYQLNDKASKSKLLKAAKRSPIETEENSTSTNLIFSAGAWYHVALPSAKYFDEVQGDKTCKIGDYNVKIGGIKLGKESNGKHVNTQIVFYAGRDKIVCHMYNTTQLILINGNGYQKFIDIFLKPFFESKINECLENIELFNDEVTSKLGPKTVKRSDVKLKRGSTNPCSSCEFISKSGVGLKKHKKLEHILGDNSTNRLAGPRQSTRNNSVVENLMIEDITATDIENDGKNVLEEKSLKYTCKECNYATTNKGHIDDHVSSKHLPHDDEEVKFVCTICKHEFNEAEDYDSHVKIHEEVNKEEDIQFSELENRILIHLTEYDTPESANITYDTCEFKQKEKCPLKFIFKQLMLL